MDWEICVIISAAGLLPKFRQCLASVINLDYPNFEIIVVDDGLDKDSREVLEKFKDRITVLNSAGRGPSFARNLAAKNTKAVFLAFTDSDCIVDKNWLKELRQGFEFYPDAAACGGRQELPQAARKFERQVFLFMKRAGFFTDYVRKVKNNRFIEVNHNPSCNVMYRRDIFLKQEGFLENLWPGEDLELDYRLRKQGYKLIFNSQAIVYHYRVENFNSFFKMMFRYGKAQGFLVRKYGIFRRLHLLPFLSVLAFFLLLFNPPFLALFIVAGLLTAVIFFQGNIYLFLLGISAFVFWHLGFLKAVCFKSYYE